MTSSISKTKVVLRCITSLHVRYLAEYRVAF
jgi:hypothetical protein